MKASAEFMLSLYMSIEYPKDQPRVLPYHVILSRSYVRLDRLFYQLACFLPTTPVFFRKKQNDKSISFLSCCYTSNWNNIDLVEKKKKKKNKAHKISYYTMKNVKLTHPIISFSSRCCSSVICSIYTPICHFLETKTPTLRFCSFDLVIVSPRFILTLLLCQIKTAINKSLMINSSKHRCA